MQAPFDWMPVCLIYLICIATVMAVTVMEITVLDFKK